MLRRLELGAALVVLLLLAVGAGMLGTRRASRVDDDPRRSTFLAGPAGARGLADALHDLGVTVIRDRRRTLQLVRGLPPRPGTVIAVISPTETIDAPAARALARYPGATGGLVAAGGGSAAIIRCFGYLVHFEKDSVQAVAPGAAVRRTSPWIRQTLRLRPAASAVSADKASDDDEAAADTACVVPRRSAETLLATAAGAPVAVRLSGAGTGSVVLVADGSLFTNRALRDTDAGEFALGLFAGRYDRVVFDEVHHGFGAAGSLTAAVLSWSGSSPWGWMAWQLAVVGLLALVAGAVRFGPPRQVIDRKRRSPLEHVRALAAALAAARGHDQAIATQVRGLRRRLARDGAADRTPPGPWLAELAANVRTPRAQSAVATLRSLTSGPQRAGGVLQAADAVEDLWEELRP